MKIICVDLFHVSQFAKMSKKVKSYAPDPISAPADESMMTGGRMLFTGPDYLRDHQVKVEDEHRYIGMLIFTIFLIFSH